MLAVFRMLFDGGASPYRPPARGEFWQTFGASYACLFITRKDAHKGTKELRDKRRRRPATVCYRNDVANAGTSFYNVSMCGRFTKNYTWQQIQALYRLTVPAAIRICSRASTSARPTPWTPPRSLPRWVGTTVMTIQVVEPTRLPSELFRKRSETPN